MKRVTGIGGIFFNSANPVALRAWYKAHLGIDVQEWGGTAFTWTDSEGCTVLGDAVESEFGKFAWVIDPDGNTVELWEPLLDAK